jgi:hypothetical protein
MMLRRLNKWLALPVAVAVVVAVGTQGKAIIGTAS